MAVPTPGIRRRAPSNRFPKGGWQVRYRDSANMTKRRTFETKADALTFQASVRTDKARGEYIDLRKGQIPFRVLADQWIEGVSVRPTTEASYRSMLKTYILPGLGHYPIGRITPSVARAFLAGLDQDYRRSYEARRGKSGEGLVLSPARKRHIYRALVPIFNLAVDDGLIRTNPMMAKTVKQAIPRGERKQMLALNAEQVDLVAGAITPLYRVLVTFAAYTGMRAGELVALRVGDVDLKQGRVQVRESASDVNGKIHFGSPKSGKPREFGIPRFLVQLLLEHLGDRCANPKAFVFPGRWDGPMRHSNMYVRHFKPAVRAALPEGLYGLRFHDLRHTCASLLIANGEHPKAIQERLGHSSIAITMDRYGHLYREHEEALVGRLDASYRAAVGEAAPTVPAPVSPLG